MSPTRSAVILTAAVVLDLRDGKTDGGAVQVYRKVDGNTNQKWVLKTV